MMVASAIHKIKHLACCLDASKALSLASCFIGISAACLVLYFTYSNGGHTLTNNYCVLHGWTKSSIVL